MANKKRREHLYYSDGATALKYAAAPLVREKVNEERKLRKRPTVKTVKKSVLLEAFKVLGSLLLFLCALSIIVFVLKAENQVVGSRKEINNLTKQLREVTAKNKILENDINNATDFVKIRDIAMNEYGMVLPTKDDVLEVELSKGDYTVVYGDVASSKSEDINIYDVLAFIAQGW